MDNIDAVLKLIAERRVKRKKKKKKAKAKAKQTSTLSIPMNVSGNDSRMRTVVFNRDRTLSIKEEPETLLRKTMKTLTQRKTKKALPDALEELTSRASKGSLALIYALQKDVRDLSKKITQPIQQSTIPYGQRGTDRFDIQSGIQRAVAEEKRKLKIGKESVNIDIDVIDLDDGLGNTRKVKQTKTNIPAKKKRLVISPFMQPQGIREVVFDMVMNPPDIGAGGGMDTLPLPEDYLKTPSWRSTIDTYERPKLREVLAEAPTEIPYYGDETIAEMPLEGEMDGGTIAELPDEGQDSQDFGDGGGDGGGDEDVAEEEVAPPKKGRKIIISDKPPIVVNTDSGKKKGRPAGSKNKPKPETDPDKIAIIGSSALKGGGASRGKTPANSPLL